MIDLEKINSLQNKQIKILKKISLKKYRQELNLFKIENFKIIQDALKSGHIFNSLFVTEKFILENAEAFNLIKAEHCNNIYVITEEINKYFSELKTPSGVCAVYNLINYSNELLSDKVIYLDGISDPGNLGTIMRSALAFNFKTLVLSADCVDIYNYKTINAAKDSIFKLNIIKDIDGDWIKNSKLPVYVSCLKDSVDLDSFVPDKSFCLVLGSESDGVSSKILEVANKKISINISSEIESLNVAAAAAIIFYKLQ